MMLGLGPWEMLILAVIVTALFGLGRVPVVARELGRLHGVRQRIKREFRQLFRFF